MSDVSLFDLFAWQVQQAQIAHHSDYHQHISIVPNFRPHSREEEVIVLGIGSKYLQEGRLISQAYPSSQIGTASYIQKEH